MNIIRLLKSDAFSGILLLVSACIAMLAANSSVADSYQQFKSLSSFWINDGLMVLFFLVISLELKREFIQGDLADIKACILPACAALGGMIVPALIYLLFNLNNSATFAGWSIPVATDIAFAVGVFALFSKGLPKSLKIFLLSLAIFDDLGAILIIAFFHAHDISLLNLFHCAIVLFVLFWLNRTGIKSLILYAILGFALWYYVLYSGLHPTLAGVLFGFGLPIASDIRISPLHRLEYLLTPLVTFLILPLFAFVNAGIDIGSISHEMLFDVVTLGIVIGLVAGKQIGILFFSWIAIQLNWSRLPKDANWLQFYGVSIICGIGFTMSLFLAALAFGENAHSLTEARLGILIGSLISCVLGAVVLFSSAKYSINSK